ncbi:MAG: STAS domain-containing protein [Candidatus Abyssobacteria bacterium SURF_5]|uniref:STAS domain-containing protein n=1 Tax=Abyssobacteria bacterium (strain SURF_5) TaxID=2093360 RepID=A0A3A4NFX9_ABYX5|nr:MAG: STAS domain-containing protein [Candidatus Abyssubacteria bacterium SURF_5]
MNATVAPVEAVARRKRLIDPVRVFPFLAWAKEINGATLRSDIIAGVTVALVLIPQSMAYAQLAGLPAYYGLYAAFIPPSIAALFGSSRQLATGPVAVVSLMTAAALEPLAKAGSEGFIAYAILLAMMVGAFQFTLGILRLGIAVNFLSHPVVNGFTNAAAIIIATSQLSKIFGVSVDTAEHHYETIWRVMQAAWHYTHVPSLGMAALAFAIMYGLKWLNPKIPNVLVAVVVTTLLAWATGFEHNYKARLSAIEAPEAREAVNQYNLVLDEMEKASEARTLLSPQITEVQKTHGLHSAEAMELNHKLALLNLHLSELKEKAQVYRNQLRSFQFTAATSGDEMKFYLRTATPEGIQCDGRCWRMRVRNEIIPEDSISLSSGGAVVGTIPKGLPKFSVPKFDPNFILQLFPMAAIISLLGFMEAISIAKAMAAKTGQRLDPNQELIGQGLANMVGSIGRSYPVSGSFSRSAVNIQAGAVTGLSSVVTSLVVVITLMLFTPLLYHLPQAVLAAIIMMAVVGLINVKGFIHAWEAQRYDGAISILSFVFTLAFAPHLDKGIMIGVALSLILYLYRNLKPGLAVLSLHPDDSLRDANRHGLEKCRYVAAIRFDGPLFFASASYLEDKVLEQVAAMPDLRHVLIVAHGINELDASGEEMLSQLVARLRDAGYDVSFSGLKDNVIDVLKRTHLYEEIGEDHMFPTQSAAIQAIHAKAHENAQEEECPLLRVCRRV